MHSEVNIPELIARLKHSNALTRRRAAEALGRYGPAAHAAIPALIDYLDDDLYGSRGVMSIQQIGDAAIPPLIAALECNPSPCIRRMCARTLESFLPNANVFNALVSALGAAKFDVRLGAATALLYGDIHTDEAVGVFVEGIQRGDSFTRYTCVLELSKFGKNGASAIPALRAACNGEELSQAATFALSKIQQEKACLKMCLPNFRISAFAGLLLGAACVFSPFGWGATHPPLPELNLLLSFGFFGLVATAGVRTMQSWWRLPHPLRPFMILLGIGQLLVLVSFSFSSLMLQNTSAHYQWTHHMTAILVGLCVLVGFALLETVRKMVPIARNHDEPDESQHA